MGRRFIFSVSVRPELVEGLQTNCDAVSRNGSSSRVRGVRIVSLLAALIITVPHVINAHDNTRPAALRDVAFDQKLNQQVPLDLEFRDENGKNVQLANYFNGKPVILTFVYFKCRDLCPLLMDGLIRSLRALSFSAGNEFNLLTVSFDAHDTPALAAAKKNDFIRQYSRTGAHTRSQRRSAGRTASPQPCPCSVRTIINRSQRWWFGALRSLRRRRSARPTKCCSS